MLIRSGDGWNDMTDGSSRIQKSAVARHNTCSISSSMYSYLPEGGADPQARPARTSSACQPYTLVSVVLAAKGRACTHITTSTDNRKYTQHAHGERMKSMGQSWRAPPGQVCLLHAHLRGAQHTALSELQPLAQLACGSEEPHPLCCTAAQHIRRACRTSRRRQQA